jgi:arginine-tRNA-protein transferase
MRLPARPLTREEFGRRLARGDRRQGLVLYRTHCEPCEACEPIRIRVNEFEPSRSQRRVFRRGRRDIEVQLGRPELTDDKVTLYARHKAGRGLMGDGDPIDAAGYAAFLVDSCVDTLELRYYVDGALIGVGIVDRSHDALSAVYTYFDPEYGTLSPGTYSILEQVELCKRWNLPYLYLGLFVAECSAMAYKSGYYPHERLLDGEWTRFAR